MNKTRKLNIPVLMGGVSNERKVSLKSGKAVAQALRDAGHNVTPVDIKERRVPDLSDLRPDVAFIALHGEFGEDGQIQNMLDAQGIAYTGSGPDASRRAMDKIASKRTFVLNSISTADYFTLESDEGMVDARNRARQLGFPLVCKPADGGSSLGVTIVESEKELDGAVECAFESGDRLLMERYVRGREFTVGVLDGEPLPMVEIVPKQDFFDYFAKYEDEETTYLTPVALIESVYRRALALGKRVYESLGCRHFARVDLLYGYDGRLYVLEVNTIPGFTPRSLLPMAAAEAGIDFTELCDIIVRLAAREQAGWRTIRKAG